MRLLIIALLLTGCATPQYAWYTHRNYEAPKSATLGLKPFTRGKMGDKLRATQEAQSKDLMSQFCSPESYVVTSEGFGQRASGAVSDGTFSATTYETLPYLNFKCVTPKSAQTK